jgi:two-component system response regulator FixJ
MSEHLSDEIVVIDDDPAHLDFLVTALQRDGFAVTGFGRSRDALHYIVDHPVGAVVVDLNMPQMDGLEIVRRLQATVPTAPVIGVTGAATPLPASHLRTLRLFGAVDCLRKPIDVVTLCDAVRRAIGVPRKH